MEDYKVDAYPEWVANSHWIIRSAGERTTQICYKLIAEFVPERQIEIVQERPFTAAILKTFERGKIAGKKWTVCIDADVFVYKDGFQKLFEVADSVKKDVWYVQGLTIDKFIPIIRTAGTGIYRTSMMQRAAGYVPEPDNSLRPESEMMARMVSKGHKMLRTPIVVGMHDFEQDYIDILRKAGLHYHKHHLIRDEMLNYWNRMKQSDADFRVAILGANHAIQQLSKPIVDSNYRKNEFIELLAKGDFIPKSPPKALDGRFVEEFIIAFKTDKHLQAIKFPEYTQFTTFQPPTRAERWSNRRKKAITKLIKFVKRSGL